jgi:ribosomal protein S14
MLQQHGQSRMCGPASTLIAQHGQLFLAVDQAQHLQQLPPRQDSRGGRRMNPCQRTGFSDAPTRQLKHQLRQVGLQHFRFAMRRQY